MGIASLVLGIVSVVIAWIPGCNVIALLPSIVGLVLGIVDWVKKSKSNQPKGMAIAGTILSAISLILIVIITMGLLSLAAVAADEVSTIISIIV